jgi:hypothetical protein
MLPILSRRGFVTTCTAGTLAGLAHLSFLDSLPALAGEPSRSVPLSPELEPLVRLIEDTPRESLLEKIADRIRHGANYQDLLGAVFLAGVRGIQPRPVGFKFHAVLVINSAHLASLAAEDRDRWLPLFWSIDNFKASQARNKSEGGWMMAPVAESKLPTAPQAHKRFVEAMDNWDEEGADAAVSALARSAGASEIYELLWRYGARDFRDIGHKAIYAANSYRTLQTIGWRHAEPVLRSLAYAMLEHEGTNPAKRDADQDRPGRENLKLAQELEGLGRGGKLVPEAGEELLVCIRTGTPKEASAKVADLLKKGVHPDSIWDGLFLAGGEMLMRQPGIVGLHTMTSANALHFASQMTSGDETRRYLMLQAAAFLTMFRGVMTGRGKVGEVRLDKLEKGEVKEDAGGAMEEIFADVSKDRMSAARKTLALLEETPERIVPLMAAARRLVFAKGRDSHDYKFSSAALEDYYHLTPTWRARYAAATMFNLKGTGDGDNDLIKRTREALARS